MEVMFFIVTRMEGQQLSLTIPGMIWQNLCFEKYCVKSNCPRMN